MNNVTKHTLINDSFKVQDRSVAFNTTKYTKFIYMVLDSILPLTFKKLPFIRVWYSIKDKKTGTGRTSELPNIQNKFRGSEIRNLAPKSLPPKKKFIIILPLP